MAFPQQLKYTLAAQSVSIDREPQQALSGDFPSLIMELKEWAQTDNDGVAISYFFRQYALFISAQFDLLAHQNAYFACSWRELKFDRSFNYGFHLLQTHASSLFYTHVQPAQRYEAMHDVLVEHVHSLIQEFRQHAKISPIILWENILGSIIWLYAGIERSNPRKAAEDMEWLLEPSNWQPIKTSYLNKLLGDVPLGRAVSGPLRKTCCLYKELPEFGPCTYCPQPN